MPALRKFIAGAVRNFIPNRAIIPILFGPLRGARWMPHAGVLSYWLGIYERRVQEQLKNIIKKGDVVFDIGAHVGFYTLFASRFVGPHGRVFSFEPNPQNIYYLNRHIEINKCKNVAVIEAAVSEHTGIEQFHKAENDAMGSLHPLDPKPVASIKVSAVSLDRELEQGKIYPPQVMKIDVEGEEYRVLGGACGILKNYAPKIILSLHGKDSARKCIKFLKILDYEIFSLSGVPLQNIEGGEVVACPPKP